MPTDSLGSTQSEPWPILRLSFRPFFLFGSLFSIVALFIWLSLLSGSSVFDPFGGAIWWHSHEMLFGFVAAIIVGFLLTAVQTWTGVPSIKGGRLLFLLLLWLSARLLLLASLPLSGWWSIIVDLAFLPIAAIFFAIPIIRVKQYRNLVFVPILSFMSIANALMHWGVLSGDTRYVQQGSYSMIMLVSLVMSIIGGRIIPMFTANGTKTKKVPAIAWLEQLSIISMVLMVLIFITQAVLPKPFIAGLAFAACVSHFFRFFRWRFWVTFRVPLVWSLHLSYVCIPVGLLLLSAHYAFDVLTLAQAMHVLTIGGMGTMILSMISRVSLGHTGRPLIVGTLMSAAYGLVFVSAVVRTFGGALVENYQVVMACSIFAWAAGYGAFIVRYLKVLTRARVDGRAG